MLRMRRSFSRITSLTTHCRASGFSSGVRLIEDGLKIVEALPHKLCVEFLGIGRAKLGLGVGEPGAQVQECPFGFLDLSLDLLE